MQNGELVGRKSYIMDYLDFLDVSFLTNSTIGHLCKDLDYTVVQCVWYVTFQVLNTKWL